MRVDTCDVPTVTAEEPVSVFHVMGEACGRMASGHKDAFKPVFPATALDISNASLVTDQGAQLAINAMELVNVVGTCC